MKAYKCWIIMNHECFAEAFRHIKDPFNHEMTNRVKIFIFLYDGLLRCHGRSDQANIPDSNRFTLLSPKLILYSMHLKINHEGLQQKLCKLREHF